MIDTDEMFKKKLYGSERNIRKYRWFDLG